MGCATSYTDYVRVDYDKRGEPIVKWKPGFVELYNKNKLKPICAVIRDRILCITHKSSNSPQSIIRETANILIVPIFNLFPRYWYPCLVSKPYLINTYANNYCELCRENIDRFVLYNYYVCNNCVDKYEYIYKNYIYKYMLMKRKLRGLVVNDVFRVMIKMMVGGIEFDLILKDNNRTIRQF